MDTDGKSGGLGPATGYGSDDSFKTLGNYGSVVDIAAPGVNILSTSKVQSYAVLSVTGTTSPRVTGAVALFLPDQSKPLDTIDVEFVREIIISVGFLQNGGCSFLGDPDGIAEAVVNASLL